MGVVEIPQVQTVEKVVEVPEVQTVAGATRSVNLPSAPVRQTAPAEVVQVTEVGLGGAGVTTSLGGGFGGAVTNMGAPVTVAAPAISTSLGGGFGGAPLATTYGALPTYW